MMAATSPLSPNVGVGLMAISEDDSQDVFREEPFEYYQNAAQQLVNNEKYNHRNMWMSGVHDNTPLYTINIPGSRDSLHRHTMTIMDQLNAGIRFIDVRAHAEPKTVLTEEQRRDVSFYSLQVSGDAGWCEFGTTVLNPCLEFLTANPTETVVMLVTVGEPLDASYPNLSEIFQANYVIDSRDWVFDSANPSTSNPMRWTMADCRSKIVLITRGEWNNLSSPTTRSLEFPEHLDTNGIFEKEETLYGFVGENGPYDKAARVTSKISEVMLSTPNAIAPDQPIDKTRDNIYNKFYITFVSGFEEKEAPPEPTPELEDASAVDEKQGDGPPGLLTLELEDEEDAVVEGTSEFMQKVNLYLTEFLMVSLIRSRRVGWIVLDTQEEKYDHLIGLIIRSNDQMFDRPPRLQSLWIAPPVWTGEAEVETPELTGDKVFEKICSVHARFSADRGLINVGFGEKIRQREDDLEVQWITNELDDGDEGSVTLDISKTLCGLTILSDVIPKSGVMGIKNIRAIYNDGSVSDWVAGDSRETATTKINSKIVMFGVGSVRAVYIPQVGIINLAVG